MFSAALKAEQVRLIDAADSFGSFGRTFFVATGSVWVLRLLGTRTKPSRHLRNLFHVSAATGLSSRSAERWRADG